MLLFLVGLLAILFQIVLLRELNVAFYGVELVYALALAAWMAGGAAGAAFAPRWRAATPGRVAGLLMAVAVALPADVALVRASRLVLGGIPGAYLPFDRQLLALAASTLPPAFVLGLAFRGAAHLAAATGRTLAQSYAIESAGAVVGAAAATAAFAFGGQTFTVAVLTAGLVPSALLAAAAKEAWGPAGAALLLVVALSTTTTAGRLASGLDLPMTVWTHSDVVETRDSPYARVTAAVGGSQTALFLDDVLVFESEAARQEELAHLTALQHPVPRRILLLGGSVEGLEHELRRHAPERLDIVELDRVYVGIATRRLRLASHAVFADPREFLRRGTKYDVIVVAMPQPTSGQSSRFYTSEFYAECQRRLAPGGVLGFRLELPEDVLTSLAALRAASVVEAVRSAFPFVEVLQGTSAIVLASAAPLSPGADVLSERWRARGLDTRLVTPAYLRYLYENERRAELARRLRAARAPMNRDARPVCYQFAVLTWLAKFYPGILRIDAGALNLSLVQWPVILPCALGFLCLFLAARRWAAARTTLLAGVAGFAGMALETVLLLDYQARSGALFERLGALMTAFMAGMAIGAWQADRSMRSAERSGRTPLRPGSRGVAVSAVALLACLSATVALIVRSSTAAPGFAGSAVMLFAAGAVVSAIFASASAASHGTDGSGFGRLYGADLAGGAAGSLLAGLVLVPLAGAVPTTWAVAALSVLALLLA
jgi:spermidine synthase